MNETTNPTTGTVRARVHRNWVLKMAAIAAVMLGLGAWGVYDAFWAYPDRGHRAARFLEWQYLQKLRETNRLSQASVPDPAAALKDLQRREAAKDRLSDAEVAQLQWLEALRNTYANRPEFTTYPRTNPREEVGSPDERLAALGTEWTQSTGNKKAPTPLTFYDIPMQWVFMIVGFGFGGYLVVLMLKVFGQKYLWDPANKVLTLPDGVKIGLNDIADFDKRAWQKYIIYLQMKPGHPSLGGKELRLDLLRHRQLEDWVLEMERTLFPDRAEPTPAADEAKPEPAPAEEPPAR